jgi:hypothetical protein
MSAYPEPKIIAVITALWRGISWLNGPHGISTHPESKIIAVITALWRGISWLNGPHGISTHPESKTIDKMAYSCDIVACLGVAVTLLMFCLCVVWSGLCLC